MSVGSDFRWVRRSLRRVVWPCVAVVVFLLASCAKDYVTGKRTFSLVSESQEIQMGAEADPEIVAQYGIYDDADLAKFVDDVGQSIARVCHRPQLEYTVRLVDSPIVNAFALPGGFTYVTRGILAHFNSEDELAGVMGHEIGHVVARHGAEQMSRQQVAGLGLGVTAILWEDFRPFAQAAGAGVGMLFLKFSRDQESESDRLGVEYSTKLGYDSHRMAEFFTTLKRMREQSGQSLPGFLSTHPDPADREATIHRLTEEWRQKTDYKPRNLTRYDYYKRIDGLVYGNDPRQGFEEGGVFYHPGLKFKFNVPGGWQLANTPAYVQMMNGERTAAIQFSTAKGESPRAAADAFVTDSKVTVVTREATTVAGFPAYVVESAAQGGDGDLGVHSTFIEKGEHVFVFHGFAGTQNYAGHKPTFRNTASSFDKVTDPKVLDKAPRRIRIKQVPRSGELRGALVELGAAEDMLEELALINGRRLDDRVEVGEWLKLVE